MPLQLLWTYDTGAALSYPLLACRDDDGQPMVVVQDMQGPSVMRLQPHGGLVWQTTLPVTPAAEEGMGGRLLTRARWHLNQPTRLFTHDADVVFEIDPRDGSILRSLRLDFVIHALAFARLSSGEFQLVVGGPVGQVLAFDRNFAVRWHFTGKPGPLFHSIFVFDFDGDGNDDIFFSLDAAPEGHLYRLSARGETRWEKSIPKELDSLDGHVDTLAFGDVDGDGYNEMVTCTGPALFDHQGTRRWLLPAVVDHGQVVQLLPRPEGDGCQIVIVDAWTRHPRITSLDASGDILWRFEPKKHIFNLISLDCNGDGKLEVLCAEQSFRFAEKGVYQISVLDLNGNLLDVTDFEDTGSVNYDSFHAGFIQGAWKDNGPLDYEGPPLVGWGGTAYVCACDLDGDKCDEIVLTTWDGRVLVYGWR